MRRSGLALFVAVLAGLTASCAGDPHGPAENSRVQVSPSSPSIRAGTTQTFTATVEKVTNPTVSWTVNGVAGGSAITGTIVSTGPLTATYTAPAILPLPNTVTVEATVTTHLSLIGDTTTTLLNPIPQLSSATPPQIDVGNFTLTLNGSNFVSGAVVNMGTSALTTTFVSSTKLTATGTIPSSQTEAFKSASQTPIPVPLPPDF